MRVSELVPERLGATLIADTGFGHENVPAPHAAASVSITAVCEITVVPLTGAIISCELAATVRSMGRALAGDQDHSYRGGQFAARQAALC